MLLKSQWLTGESVQGACTESLRLSVNKTRRKLGKREGALKEKEQEKYDRKT